MLRTKGHPTRANYSNTEFIGLSTFKSYILNHPIIVYMGQKIKDLFFSVYDRNHDNV